MTTPSEKPDYLGLCCVCQNYAWGKVGMDSEVARLKESAEGEDFVVGEKQTYAEVNIDPLSGHSYFPRSLHVARTEGAHSLHLSWSSTDTLMKTGAWK